MALAEPMLTDLIWLNPEPRMATIVPGGPLKGVNESRVIDGRIGAA